ncbi:MAG: methionyl-tRNA formyltransferase [Solirubrobacteraceae bacterium]|nr:methionyl-tRNA formyltransferase [Solirubrobacteraceae bacterium]
MRTAFLGTTAFAAAILGRLGESAHRPALVISRPDAPAGRGRRLTAPPVADTARALGIELHQPPSVNDEATRRHLAAAAPEAVVVCAFGALIKEPLLSDFPMYNVHPSLLPRWRGAAPVERAIMAGDAETGVGIMRLTAGLDEGPVCLQGREPIAPDDDYASLAERLEVLGADLLIRALDEQPPFVPQPEDGATYAEKITGADRTLDPAAPAAAQERVVRALHPHIGARVDLGAEGMLGVHAARALAPGTGGPAGALTIDGDRALYGDLELVEVQPPGRRAMPAAAWLRGRG